MVVTFEETASVTGKSGETRSQRRSVALFAAMRRETSPTERSLERTKPGPERLGKPKKNRRGGGNLAG